MSLTSKDGFLAVAGSFLGLTTITVGLRFYARHHQGLPYKADDAFAAIGWVAFVVSAAIQLTLVHYKELGYTDSVEPTMSLKESDIVRIAA